MLKENSDYKSKDQISGIKDTKKLNNGWKKVIKFYKDFTRMVYQTK